MSRTASERSMRSEKRLPAMCSDYRGLGPGIAPESWIVFSRRSTRPKLMAWGWACRFAARSSKSHGGRLSASRGHPHGAVFQLVLPIGSELSHEANQTITQSIVFVVDDDEALRDALTSLFRVGWPAGRDFGSTAEFLQSKLPDVPSCLVLDVRLPGLSGLDFQAELAKANIQHPDHLHHRPRRYSDDGAGDEGRRGRVPDQAVSRSGPARCRSGGACARSGAARERKPSSQLRAHSTR